MRCAIYTRKSSEEGLEQAFNSLDAHANIALNDAMILPYDANQAGWNFRKGQDGKQIIR